MPKDSERSQIIPPYRREAEREPEHSLALRGPQPRRRRTDFFVSLTLVALAAIVVLTGLLTHFSSTSSLVLGEQATMPARPPGPFVKPPYSVSQVNALRHLVDHMTYREQNNYSNDLDYMITQLHVGGMIMYESHLQTASQARATTSQTQQRAKIPLLISVDEEGGAYVNRLAHIYGSRHGPTEISQTGSLVFDHQQGVKMAQDVLSIGVTGALAPAVGVLIIKGYDTEACTF